jgi:hypothetical protein
MLTRLLQAIAITSAVYLMMITHQSSGSQPAFLVGAPYSTVSTSRFTHLLAEVLDFLRPSQRGSARHSVNATGTNLPID